MQPAASSSDDPTTSAELIADSPASRRRRGGGQDSATSAAKARPAAGRRCRGLLAVRRAGREEHAVGAQGAEEQSHRSCGKSGTRPVEKGVLGELSFQGIFKWATGPVRIHLGYR